MLTMCVLGCYYDGLSQFCDTEPGDAPIGPLPGFAVAMSGPVYLNLYIHAIGKDNGDDRPTIENVNASFSIIADHFKRHEIYFVWDCHINLINSTSLYNLGSIECDLVEFGPETDGIHLFIGPDNAPALGYATGIPSRYIVVKGSLSCSGINDSDYVLSRSTVIAHEMGHALGLWHTHHGSEGGGLCGQADPDECPEFVNGSNSLDCGDYVEDTPADPQINACQATVFYNCNFVTMDVDANQDSYDPDESLIMSYAHPRCHERFTAGQGERMRRMISYAGILQDCIVEPDMTGPVISSNSAWTIANTPNGGEFWIEGDLIIESGYTLDIDQGVTIHFGRQSSLIVKPNAMLILRGKLTGVGCNGLTWRGVKVWGSSESHSQYVVSGYRAQGRVLCYDGAWIENADTGIELFGPLPTLAGGQLSATSLTIRNCPVGIQIMPYKNFWPFTGSEQGQPRNYFCSVRSSNFIVNDTYSHEDRFDAFIKMTGVNGVNVSGSVFTNDMTIDGVSEADWGYGISAVDAGFILDALCLDNPLPNGAPCEVFARSEFNNLGYGVYTSRLLSGQPFQIKQSDFNGCFVGVRVKGVSGGTILFNNFNLGKLPSLSVTDVQSGICFEAAIAGFTCEENTFINVTENTDLITLGIFSQDTGDDMKDIRRNHFEGLRIGNGASGYNGFDDMGMVIVKGLIYLCNQNYNVLENGVDFDVSSGRIGSYQLFFKEFNEYYPAGNRFSYTGVDFNNSGDGKIEYVAYEYGVNEVPLEIQGDIDVGLEDFPNLCSSSFCEPPCLTPAEISDLKSDFADLREDHASALTAFKSSPSVGQQLNIAYYESAMYNAAFSVVLHQLYDTLTYHEDSLRVWLSNIHSLSSYLWLSGHFLANGDTSMAGQVIDSVLVWYNSHDEHEDDMIDVLAITQLLFGKDPYDLDSLTLSTIAGFDTLHTQAGHWARSILSCYGAHYPVWYDFSEAVIPRSPERSREDVSITPVEYIRVFPNPSSHRVTFDGVYEAHGEELFLKIIDLHGREVFYQRISEQDMLEWEAEKHPAGIYLYLITGSSGLVQSGKILVVD